MSNNLETNNNEKDVIGDFFNKMFNKSVISTDEVNFHYAEGTITGYNKAYKTIIDVKNNVSSSVSDWGRNVYYKTYVTTTVSSENIPVVDFWVEFRNGEEQQFSIIYDVPMRPGHEVLISFLTLDGTTFYLYQIDNRNTDRWNRLIGDADLKGFVKANTSRSFAITVAAVIAVAFALLSPQGILIYGIIAYFVAHWWMKKRNLSVLKERISQIWNSNS